MKYTKLHRAHVAMQVRHHIID